MTLEAGSAQTNPTTGLAGAIHTAILASGSTPVDSAALQKLCDGIAAGVVDYLVANAVVLPTLLVAPSGGGPVTGTGGIQ